MTLRIPAKVLLHVWSYDFYDMTLSTGKQRRHMIKFDIKRLDQQFFSHVKTEPMFNWQYQYNWE